MHIRRFFVAAALILGCAASSAAQGVKLEFRDGRVSLSAQNVPVRTILNEWARLGGTKIVNGDRVPGGLVTLELNGVPERQALDTLLRNVPGYMAGPRTAGQEGGPSSYASILILATSGGLARPAAPPVTATAPAPPPAAGAFRLTRPVPQIAPPSSAPPDPDDDAPGQDIASTPAVQRLVPVNGNAGNPRPFVPGTPPNPNDENDAPPPQAPATTPGNPFGVTFGSTQPGTISPVPQQPQQRPRQTDPEP